MGLANLKLKSWPKGKPISPESTTDKPRKQLQDKTVLQPTRNSVELNKDYCNACDDTGITDCHTIKASSVTRTGGHFWFRIDSIVN